MEGEIVFYEQRDLDQWRPRTRGMLAELHEDTISPLGKLYAEWSAGNRQAIDEYDRRIAATERCERKRGLNGDDPTRATP